MSALMEPNSRKSTVYPKKARNVDGAFVFIVNDEDYKQVMMILMMIIDNGNDDHDDHNGFAGRVYFTTNR